MLTNATILRIDTPGTAAGDGTITFTEGAAISARCAYDEAQFAQNWQLGGLIKDAKAVLYVPATAGLTIDRGYRIRVQADGGTAWVGLVIWRGERKKGSLSHDEVFLKEL